MNARVASTLTDRSESSAAQVNILLVDDNPQSLMALEAILCGADRNVLKANSGEEALKHLLQNEVAVIVLDIRMAGIDGYETARLIRARAATRDVPIIFMTGYNKDDAEIIKGYSFGAVDYIFKPVVPVVLRSKINVFVELAKKTEALRRKHQALEQTERELLRTKAVASLIKQAPDPIFLSDLNGTILHLNDAASELLGLRADELIEQSLGNFLTPQEAQLYTDALREVVQRGITRNLSLRPRHTSGRRTPTTFNAAAWRDSDGKIIGAIGTLRDMTEHEAVLQDLERSRAEVLRLLNEAECRERELREKQAQLVQAAKLASIGELATGVAHELNNPLNNIALFVGNVLDQLEEKENGSSSQQYMTAQLHGALQQVRRASDIIGHLRAFGRSAGRKHVRVAINDVITSARALVGEQLRLSDIEVILDLPDVSAVVNGSQIQLEQVFINLLTNARDALEQAPVKRISITSRLEPGFVEVRVQDTGVGIPAELLPRIFDPFFTTKDVGVGTGLGLSITYGIIKEHQGQIMVESQPGQGTTFTIQLPLAREESPTEPGELHPPGIPSDKVRH